MPMESRTLRCLHTLYGPLVAQYPGRRRRHDVAYFHVMKVPPHGVAESAGQRAAKRIELIVVAPIDPASKQRFRVSEAPCAHSFPHSELVAHGNCAKIDNRYDAVNITLSISLISGSIDFGARLPPQLSVVDGSRVASPGLDLRARSPAQIAVDGARVALACGAPRFSRGTAGQNDAATWLSIWREDGPGAPTKVKGTFCVVLIDTAARNAILATDRFGVHPICYSSFGNRFRFADRADSVLPRKEQTIDPQAIYDYLYFHVIPAPRTIFKGVQRLRAAHTLFADGTAARQTRYWSPSFIECSSESLNDLAVEFRRLLREAVARESTSARVGSFLSGGTDSSTIAGVLRGVAGTSIPTFSIGFEAEGYDEIAYARIASSHFGTDHHEYYVTPADLISGIPLVAAEYDQPFGNSSVLPTYYCAKAARECGVDVLLAGDGGDELFGGNTRYAKQQLFGLYERVPAWLRSAVIEPLLFRFPGVDRVAITRKAASYVRQAMVEMPDRMETYNLLDRFEPAAMFEDDFLRSIDVQDPLAHQRDTFRETRGASLVNRMLAYDWNFTLADNDLPKVVGATGLAGVSARFPMLADEVVDFSLALPSHLKVRNLQLRYFFKQALREFLPHEIIKKKKHGFGLPFGLWLSRDESLRAFAAESLQRLRDQGIVRHRFTQGLLHGRVAEHPAYYGEMVWILMMLSEWNRSRARSYDDDAARLATAR